MEWHIRNHHEEIHDNSSQNIKGGSLVDVTLRGETINSQTYIKTLEKTQRFYRVQQHKNPADLLLLHDNVRPHTSLAIWEAITKLGQTVIPYPPYSPNFSPSDFHPFVPLKDAFHGTKFQDDEGVIHAAKKQLHDQEEILQRLGIHALVSRWNKALQVDGDYVEQYQCLYDIPMYIVFEQTALEKNYVMYYFLNDPRTITCHIQNKFINSNAPQHTPPPLHIPNKTTKTLATENVVTLKRKQINLKLCKQIRAEVQNKTCS